MENYAIQFTDFDDLERFIEDRFKYFKELLDKELFMAPDYNETLTEIEVKNVLRITAKHCGILYRSAISRSRKRELVDVRRMAINYCRFRKISFVAIANALGLNHSTVMHHELTHNNLMSTDERYSDRYKDVFNAIESKLTSKKFNTK